MKINQQLFELQTFDATVFNNKFKEIENYLHSSKCWRQTGTSQCAKCLLRHPNLFVRRSSDY